MPRASIQPTLNRRLRHHHPSSDSWVTERVVTAKRSFGRGRLCVPGGDGVVRCVARTEQLTSHLCSVALMWTTSSRKSGLAPISCSMLVRESCLHFCATAFAPPHFHPSSFQSHSCLRYSLFCPTLSAHHFFLGAG